MGSSGNDTVGWFSGYRNCSTTPRKFQVQFSLNASAATCPVGVFLRKSLFWEKTVSSVPKYEHTLYSNSLLFHSLTYQTVREGVVGSLTWNMCCSCLQLRHRDTPLSRFYFLDSPFLKKKVKWKQICLSNFWVMTESSFEMIFTGKILHYQCLSSSVLYLCSLNSINRKWGFRLFVGQNFTLGSAKSWQAFLLFSDVSALWWTNYTVETLLPKHLKHIVGISFLWGLLSDNAKIQW